jgi:solute carrier family 7 (L-type amino acid transporter), member 9/15
VLSKKLKWVCDNNGLIKLKLTCFIFNYAGDDKKTNNNNNEKTVGLKREMGLMAAINVIIGVMIGSGIFISPQSALFYSGSVGACLVVWLACGFISLLGALCFAELGTVVPRSGAEYAYLIEAFSKTNKFWGPLPSFVCAWVYVMVLRPAEIAVIILTFAEYSIQPFNNVFGLETMETQDKNRITKIVALLALGKL